MTNSRADHDVVVVGAGPAGLTVASVLERAGRNVLVVEAGEANNTAEFRSGNFFAARGQNSAWRTDVLVRHTSAQDWVPYRQGQGLGGSGAVNGMVCMPGEEWDDPADRAVAHRLMDDTYTYHPSGLRLGTSLTARWHDLYGPHGRLAPAESDPAGAAGATAPALWADNPTTFERRRIHTPGQLVLESTVNEIIPGETTTVHTSSGTLSARTVIVCAGAIQTARLVAPFAVPRTIGQAVQDHPAVRLAIRLQQGARLADLTTPVVSGIARWRSQPSSKSVDLQMLVLDAVGTTAEEAAHGVVMVALMQPTSRGSLSFQPNDARLDLDMLANQHDLARLRSGLRRIIELVSSDDLRHVIEAVLVDEMGTPLESADYLCTDDQLTDRWLRQTAGDYSHVVGTAPAGVATHSGDRLGLVHRTNNVWIADASLFTSIPAANTMVPTMVMAESVGRRIAAIN